MKHGATEAVLDLRSTTTILIAVDASSAVPASVPASVDAN